jgi:hypothetical protein
MNKTRINNFVKFIIMNPTIHAYDNDYTKSHFEKESKWVLKQIVQSFAFPKGSYNVRFNPGGIAVSGEATLHEEKIYIQFSRTFPIDGFMVRQCNGQKDYTGKTNIYIKWENLSDWDDLIKKLESIRNSNQ